MTPQFILAKSLCRPASCGTSHPALSAEERRAYDIRYANLEIENLQFAAAYVEPGYSDPAKAILFANWNVFPNGVDTILERYGYSIEWSDQWSTCGCGKAFRTMPDSYCWKPSYAVVNECEEVCVECLRDDPADYLRSQHDNPEGYL